MTRTGKQKMTVPYTGELAGMVSAFFPFFTLSSVTLGLSEHPFTPALYKLIKDTHLKYTLPCSTETSKINKLQTVRITLWSWPLKLTVLLS